MLARRTRAASFRPVRILVGTSGFSYPAWRGRFYPPRLPQPQMLGFYASRLPAVEINSSFRELPTPAQLRTWAGQVPPRFSFALKVPEQITHWRRLQVPPSTLRTLAARMEVLGRKAGPVLFQLPPNFKQDRERLSLLLSRLPAGVRASFEFRHPSWFEPEIFQLLRRHRAALCIAEAEALETPKVATARFGYLRLRKERYRDAELRAWAEWILDQRWSTALVFFRHEDTARGPRDAARLVGMLDAVKSQQR